MSIPFRPWAFLLLAGLAGLGSPLQAQGREDLVFSRVTTLDPLALVTVVSVYSEPTYTLLMGTGFTQTSSLPKVWINDEPVPEGMVTRLNDACIMLKGCFWNQASVDGMDTIYHVVVAVGRGYAQMALLGGPKAVASIADLIKPDEGGEEGSWNEMILKTLYGEDVGLQLGEPARSGREHTLAQPVVASPALAVDASSQPPLAARQVRGSCSSSNPGLGYPQPGPAQAAALPALILPDRPARKGARGPYRVGLATFKALIAAERAEINEQRAQAEGDLPQASTDEPGQGSLVIRKRTCLSLASERVLQDWFKAHIANPYPFAAEKVQLMTLANIDDKQLTNWFTNTRKRFWIRDREDPSKSRLSSVRIDRFYKGTGSSRKAVVTPAAPASAPSPNKRG